MMTAVVVAAAATTVAVATVATAAAAVTTVMATYVEAMADDVVADKPALNGNGTCLLYAADGSLDAIFERG